MFLPIAALLYFVFFLAIEAALIQVSALLYKRARVSWQLTLLMAMAILLVQAGLVYVMVQVAVALKSNSAIGPYLLALATAGATVMVGALLLRGRATRRDGTPFGLADGARLMAVHVGLALAFAVLKMGMQLLR